MSLSPIINESDKHWMSLIDECRSSGLSDMEWCREHQILSTTFFNHAKKRHALACEPPRHDYSVPAAGQDVVQVAVAEEDRVCPRCGSEMIHLGEEVVREELQIIPAEVKRIQYVQEIVICDTCKKNDMGIITKARSRHLSSSTAKLHIQL